MSNAPTVMPDALRHDWGNLLALIEETAHRQVVPCRNGRTVPPTWWTSDVAKERDAAAKECRACPVLTACRDYGLEHPDEVGVYGGATEWKRTKEACKITEETSHP